MATVYEINRGVNRSIEFKGIKAQYIIYLAAACLGLLVVFAILYAVGVNMYLSLAIDLPLGGASFVMIQRYSKKYGEHGLLKKAAVRKLPTHIRTRSVNLFYQLQTANDAKETIHGKGPADL